MRKRDITKRFALVVTAATLVFAGAVRRAGAQEPGPEDGPDLGGRGDDPAAVDTALDAGDANAQLPGDPGAGTPTGPAADTATPPGEVGATDGETPHMDWERTVHCVSHPAHGKLRVQCRQAPDGSDRVCLTSTGREKTLLDRPGRPMRRLSYCEALDGGFQQLVQEGYRFVEAIAEAPPGWMRDERGRVFQVNFDLHRRIWLGARWAPSWDRDNGSALGRTAFELGFRGDDLDRDGNTWQRHRYEVLAGEVTLAPFSARATLFHYDDSRESETPALRFTTFWGEPARHDLYLNLGWWLDLVAVEHAPRQSDDDTFLRFLALGIGWDLWHSKDLDSYLRIKAGAAFDDHYRHAKSSPNDLALTPIVQLEYSHTLDRDGFHHLYASTGFEAPYVWEGDAADGMTGFRRFRNTLAYEVIVLAINDQPLTMRFQVEGGYRDDLTSGKGWDVAAGVGLRLSFWAPPRDLRPYERQPAAMEW